MAKSKCSSGKRRLLNCYAGDQLLPLWRLQPIILKQPSKSNIIKHAFFYLQWLKVGVAILSQGCPSEESYLGVMDRFGNGWRENFFKQQKREQGKQKQQKQKLQNPNKTKQPQQLEQERPKQHEQEQPEQQGQGQLRQHEQEQPKQHEQNGQQKQQQRGRAHLRHTQGIYLRHIQMDPEEVNVTDLCHSADNPSTLAGTSLSNCKPKIQNSQENTNHRVKFDTIKRKTVEDVR
ncbi:regulator of nonsense transcripts 1-like [Homarus americanus]|uniref:regulator of nonsense transcripts 1-like n=1 Tax=Homarus americanus TaxID=6706 RepID=UPI001C462771|nr:regulator of nonsense transcripts 1-like [Homarus americanus]